MRTYSAEARRFYHSKQWLHTRELYADSVDGLCERCRAKGIYTPGKIVHHKKYLDDSSLRNPDIALNFNNLELLCQDCHNKEHHHSEPGRRYAFDANGGIINKEKSI